MQDLIEDDVYKTIEIRDTQGICIPEVAPAEHNTAPRNTMFSVVNNAMRIGNTFILY